MDAGKRYREMLYGGTAEADAPSSLYADVKSPFKSLPPALTRVTVPEPTANVVKPRVDLLSQFRNAPIPVDNVKVVTETPTVNILKPEPTLSIPSAEKIRERLTGFNEKKFTKDTYTKESGGDYKAMSKVSTATGKYQFLWGTKPGKGHQDSIKRVTGVTTREEFRDSPAAQEKYYQYYLNTTIKPSTKKLASEGAKFGLDPTEVARVIHFQGVGGARTAFSKGIDALYKATKTNPSIMSYLGKGPAMKK